MGGKTDELKGRTKEAYGDLTDDERMKQEGQRDQSAGKVKGKLDDAEDWAEKKVDDLRERLDRDRH
jgi:uncharacterized protein YjbJ (UPF0337 family)